MSQAAIKVSRALPHIASAIDAGLQEVAGQRVAFSLFVWTDGRSNYISTADRAEVIAALEAHLQGWKEGMPDIPAHKVG